MVWCAKTGSGIRAQGRQGAIRVGTSGWEPSTGETPTLRCAVDASVTGRVRRLTLPASRLRLVGTGRPRLPSGQVSLTDGEVLVADGGHLETFVRFDGVARIDPPALTDGGEAGGREQRDSPDSSGGPTDVATTTPAESPLGDGTAAGRRATVLFEGPTSVTVGFREPTPDPPTVTVPPTPSGVATAITHAASALRTTGPGRSHPGQRNHPPLVAFGDRDVPAAVRRATPETGIELRLPASLSACCVAAPLSFYLGATVRVDGRRTTPVLRASSGLRREFPDDDAAFADAAATLLRRVFLLDCLVRDRPAERLSGRGLLDRVNLDADRLRALCPSERLTAYLGAPLERLDAELPAWPLATYVDGDRRTVRCLPHLLDRLSLVYPAEASELDGNSLLCRALDGFYRGEGAERSRPHPVRRLTDRGPRRRSAGDVATFDRLDPELRNARLHGWLAEGIPIEAFKPTPRAYRNRLENSGEASIEIAVVSNDPEMDDERAVADIYRDRAAGLPVDVSVHGALTCGGLADLLATPYDFVHYIGHCEHDGLRCRDGYLDAGALDAIRARTFFLNACGSYRQGQRLIEGGSVAGAVTLTTVLDQQAVTVGTAFARLLIHGAGFERALSLARQQILMGSDYAVVGDGTYALVPATDAAMLHVDPVEDGFEVAHEMLSSGTPGRSHPSPFDTGDHLHGGRPRETLDRITLVELLRNRTLPVCYADRLRWSTELADELASEGDRCPGGR
jgi:hypothetical protein